MADINIAPTPRKPIMVNLLGKPYKVMPLKAALAIEMARNSADLQKVKKDTKSLVETLKLVDLVYDWLSMVMEKKDVDAIKNRLKDPKDGLDIDHLVTLLNMVTEVSVNANPTT